MGDHLATLGFPRGFLKGPRQRRHEKLGFWSVFGRLKGFLRGSFVGPPRVLFGGHLAPGLPGRPDPDGENVELSSSLPAPGSGPGRQAVPPGARRGPGTILEGIPMTVIFEAKIYIILVWI